MMRVRHQSIVEILAEQGSVGVRDLAHRLDVSEMTIRRDLDELARRGLLVRTHGGGLSTAALHFPPSPSIEIPPSTRKMAIGKLAASLIQPGQTIMVDSGTTTLEIVRNLRDRADVSVATVSLLVAHELLGSEVNVTLIGGQVRKDFPGTYGPLTEKWLSGFRVDVLFISCDAADSTDGFYLADAQVSSLVQAMICIADRIIVVAESGKFGRRAFVRFAVPAQVKTLVTDAGLSTADRRNLEDKGVRVLIAEESNPDGQIR